MKKIYSLLAVAMLLLASNNALAGGGGSSSTFYFKVTATSTNAAEGLVYAASAATDSKTYVETDTVTFTKSATSNSTSNTFHYYAQPEPGNKFVGWTADPTADSVVYVSNQKHFSRSLTSNKKTEADPATANFFAVFAEATEFFSSKVIAQAVGAEGTVSVSTASGSTEYAAEMADSITESVDTLHTYYLRAVAAEGEETRFVAWYTDNSLETRLSTNANYTYTVKANDPEAMLVYNVYAKFEVIPYLLSNVSASVAGPGKVAVLTASNQTPAYDTQAQADQRKADAATHTYYLRAQGNDADFVEFEGWYIGDSLISSNTSYTWTVASNANDTAYAVTAHFAARNPYQFRNASFEKWSNNEPIGWHGPRTAVGSMAGASGMAPAPAKVADAHSGENAVRLISNSVLGVAANGNLTTGVMNMGSWTPTASSNNNHTVIDDPNYHLVILGQPDSIVCFAKFSRGDTTKVYTGTATAYIHDSVANFQDPTLESQVPHMIAKAVAELEESGEWIRCSGAFEYAESWSAEAAQNTTKFILCDLATNPEAGVTSGDTLIVDDIMFIYNSTLDSAFYAGAALEFVDGAAVVNAAYNEAQLVCYKGGRGAIVETAFEMATSVLTITVKGQDYEYNTENKHVYTITFSGYQVSETRENLYENGAYKYGTICLPLNVEAAEVSNHTEEVVFFEVVSASNEGAILEEVSALEAGKAYVFRALAESFTITTVVGEPVVAATEQDYIHGNLASQALDVPTNDYILFENELHQIQGTATATVAQYHAYFSLPAGANTQARLIERSDIVTDIENVETLDLNKFLRNGKIFIRRNGQLFDLNGKLVK